MSSSTAEPMGPNTSAANTSPRPDMMGTKRKADDVFKGVVDGEEKENGRLEKKRSTDASSARPSLVDCKNHRLTFKQSPPARNLPRRKLLNFEGYLLDEMEAGRAVTEIPEEHWGLIAMAGHELTAATEATFVKQIKATLGNQDSLSSEALNNVTSKLFSLRQYGFISTDFQPTTKIPSALQIRCWEVDDLEQWFAADQIASLRVRKAEREKAREDCLRVLKEMDEVERREFISGKDEKDKEKASRVKLAQDSPEPTVAAARGSEGPEDSASLPASSPVKPGRTPEEIEAARLRKLERDEKKASLLEKKAARDRESKKKEETMAKQAKKMSMFFKSKPASKPSPGPFKISSPVKIEASESDSDYRRSFKPVPPRPHVKVAKINTWVSGREECVSGKRLPDVEGWHSRDFIADHLKKHGHEPRQPGKQLPRGLKTAPINGSVAEVWATLQDAEEPREVLDQLRDRKRFPWKILAFDQQPRPPYSGTFTKKSLVVGPRTPFAQDPIIDYSYDSGDEWQDDENGEDVDDFGASKPEEEDEDDEAEEGEFDDWLDDSDDVEVSHPSGLDLDDPLAPKHLPAKVVKKPKEPPVKRFIKLTPTWKGPIWEEEIGEKGTEGLESYRIQLLNDTPDSVDPFTYTSSEPVQQFKSSYSTAVIGMNLGVKCLHLTEPIAYKPPPASRPPQSAQPQTKSDPNTLASSTLSSSAKPSADRAGRQRSSFPAAHLEELYRLIDGDKRYRNEMITWLREKFDKVTTKAAIEQELKRCACRGRLKDSIWRVYREAWVAAGLEPPEDAPNTPVVVDQPKAPHTPSHPSETRSDPKPQAVPPLESIPPVQDTATAEPIQIDA